VRADVAHGPQLTALVPLQAPVPVRVVQQPILEIPPGDQPNVSELALANQARHVLVEWVEADVEVDRVDQTARRGKRGQLRRLPGRQRQRLLADDVPTRGEDLLDLWMVELVR
jgi:hypothetical protein